ncbi:hypothetical protein DYBT9275_02737 [Dyadobacter sp. CECT 9275]|uniref:Uncharacterized protein n=1 Tax=Dyadobacter helix TaxID=2822344 RepID=A0A916NC14_9BACT|nr:hypothetical protein [Dyadobacter sp. CECT 9275]CAG5001764.1 hypothetical protein DYBT9275_02737 [Dyadobacter sp. CECT 9275]
MNIREQVKTIEDACRLRGVEYSDITPWPEPKNDFQKAVNNFAHSVIVIEALNEGKVPDYDNGEPKFELWWDMRGQAAGGSGFSFGGVLYLYSDSFVGARLVFIEEENAEYFSTQFPHLFEGFMVVKK